MHTGHTHHQPSAPARDAGAEVVTADDHVRGAASSALTIIEYGAYDPARGVLAERLVVEAERHCRGGVRHVFRHFPSGVPGAAGLSMRATAARRRAWYASEAAEAAAAQDRFWEMHALLRHREIAGELDDLVSLAETLELDVHRFEHGVVNHLFLARVERDDAGAHAAGLREAPAFLLNGERYGGPLEPRHFLAAADHAIQR